MALATGAHEIATVVEEVAFAATFDGGAGMVAVAAHDWELSLLQVPGTLQAMTVKQ